MSDIDLTEAVEAAASGVLERQVVSDKGRPLSARAYAHAAVTAALPHIERQARERVTREIEAEADRRRRDADETATARGGTRDPHQDAVRFGLDLAVRIARGES